MKIISLRIISSILRTGLMTRKTLLSLFIVTASTSLYTNRSPSSTPITKSVNNLLRRCEGYPVSDHDCKEPFTPFYPLSQRENLLTRCHRVDGQKIYAAIVMIDRVQITAIKNSVFQQETTKLFLQNRFSFR